MKKVLSIVLLAVIVIACNKPDIPEPEPEEQKTTTSCANNTACLTSDPWVFQSIQKIGTGVDSVCMPLSILSNELAGYVIKFDTDGTCRSEGANTANENGKWGFNILETQIVFESGQVLDYAVGRCFPFVQDLDIVTLNGSSLVYDASPVGYNYKFRYTYNK